MSWDTGKDVAFKARRISCETPEATFRRLGVTRDKTAVFDALGMKPRCLNTGWNKSDVKLRRLIFVLP